MSTFLDNAPAWPRLLEEMLIKALQLVYEADKKSVETPWFILGGKVIFDTIRQGKLGSLLKRNIENLTESETLMDALRREMAGCQLLITSITLHLNLHTALN